MAAILADPENELVVAEEQGRVIGMLQLTFQCVGSIARRQAANAVAILHN